MDAEKRLIEGSIADIRSLIDAKTISIVELTAFYLARIEAHNQKGVALNAVRSLAPGALAAAQAADGDIAAGRLRGPLHGIPVLLKDNILTADGIPASAGAAALRDFMPTCDAMLVSRLRQAGAIVLGKTNMTEFADYVSDVMPSGFSGAGGMVKNPHTGPYGRGQGSSVGSASAVSAGLAPVAIGSETQNSIQAPATLSSVFGFKPSVGLVSRTGVVPLVTNQDSPGPLTRCVEDAALVVAILAGADIDDGHSLTLHQPFAPCGSLDIRGLRIGVPRRTVVDRPELAEVLPMFEDMLSALSKAGAKIVDPCDLPSAEQIRDATSLVFRTEFKVALNAFLASHGAPCGIDSLETLIGWNEAHPDAIPYGQSLLLAAQKVSDLSDPAYRADRLRDVVLSRTAGIDAAMQLGVDVLLAPMSVLAKCTGKAGAPVLAIPVGLDPAGAPFGVTLCAPLGHDAKLLAAGTAIAAIVADRRIPSLHP